MRQLLPRARLPRRRRGRAPGGTLLRGIAAAALGAAFVVPVARRRLGVHPLITTAAAASGPVALAVLRPRTKGRDAGLYALQMWAFTMAHELPYDDPQRLQRRLKVRYPIVADRLLGRGRLPNAQLQDALSRPGTATRLDRFLSMVHWAWFLQPHASLLYILLRHDELFARAARQMAVTYDLGCVGYAAVPTAPPWWASENGYAAEPVRRVMVEVGEEAFGRTWPLVYGALGGNPWAAMPSLHFGSAVMAALLLAEANPAAGAIGWGYAMTLGFALVYLGEHYVLDLAVGAGLVAAVRRGEPRVEPVARRLSAAVQRLEGLAA